LRISAESGRSGGRGRSDLIRRLTRDTLEPLPLYTCNPGDFAGIDGLEVVPVPYR